ncbi:MAG: ABC transporter ATP-binding protein [Dorea sp.]|nr:ABC transporter ATP-binding protein [Dorea sp.]
MKQKQLTYWEALKLNYRSLIIWQKFCPKLLLSILASSVFEALSPYVTIWLSARIINELAGNRNPQELIRLVLLQISSAAIMALIGGILSRWKNYEKESSDRIHSKLYMEKMFRLDYADIDRQYIFDLYSQILQNDKVSCWGFRSIVTLFEKLSTATLQCLGGIGMTVTLFLSPVPKGNSSFAFLNHPLSIVMVVSVMLLTAVLSTYCSNRSIGYWLHYMSQAKLGNRYFRFYGMIDEYPKRMEDFRIYSQHENVYRTYVKACNLFAPDSKLAKCARGPMGLCSALSQAIYALLTGIICLFVCLKSYAGAFGVGSVTQYISAITRLFLGICDILRYSGPLYANGEFLKTSFEFLDLPNTMYQGSLTTEKRSDRQYEIEFRDVSFQYPGCSQYALRHVNLKFRIGSRLAVVGMNGSGKTTFIKLLCRLYDPCEGQILLNGIDIRKYQYDDYINLFSVVFQDFRLFALPLGENVAGKADYDRRRAKKCLEQAGFSDKLTAMPEGLDTYLYKEMKPNGVNVSGGEAQKIALARALYKDSPFIILDEPTAALDPVAEMEIYSKFNDIAGDKTAVYISHRLSSCKFCDEIAVFHEGAIIQQGSHEELVADEMGKYYELWHAQAQYYVNAG